MGPYELRAVLGQGGMGEVWDAVLHGPHGFRRRVALKLLSAGPDADAQPALAREARIGALILHPNVVGVHELGVHDGQWYLAMELVDGPTAERLARVDALRPRHALEIALQTCAALAHIHALPVDGAQGVVHRDVKPSNLLVDRYGLVKLGDLGLAGVIGATGSGGTPGYQAPEQLAGQAQPRSDLFSLGVTLYRLLTGRRPFPPHEPERLLERLADPALLEPAERAAPGIGPVLARCLAADPADRWPTADALAAAIRPVLAALPDGASLAEVVAASRGDAAAPGPLTPWPVPATNARRSRPRPADAFVGREDEIAALLEAFERPGLVVALGAGGMGKTRGVTEAARRVEASRSTWLVDLSECRSLDEACGAVGSALGVPLLPGDPVEQLGRALATRGAAVFVLDNVEAVAPVLADALGRWRAAAPEGRFVVTTRVRPPIPADRVVEFGPLPTAAAVELFEARCGAASRPDRAVVRELVDRLDGMPLAIELAAARTRALPVEAVLEHLRDRFRLLVGTGGEGAGRHRSLRASLDASWALLRPWEQSTLAQLTRFVAPFELDAASSVVDLAEFPAAPWLLDVIGSLVDHSLVHLRGDRFALLASVREYAASHALAEERAGADQRHGAWFAQRGTRESLRSLYRRGGADARRRWTAELPDLVAAAERAGARGDPRAAAGAALAAAEVLRHRGPWALAAQVLRGALAAGEGPRSPELRVKLAELVGGDEQGRLLHEALAGARAEGDAWVEVRALNLLGLAELHQGRPAGARARLEEARAVAARSGDAAVEIAAASLSSTVHLEGGQVEAAARDFERVLALALATGDRRLEGSALTNLGTVALDRGRLAEAEQRYLAALELQREVGNRSVEGMVLGNLGNLRVASGRLAEASQRLEEALALHREIGDLRFEAVVLGNLGLVRLDQGRVDESRELLERALALHRQVGNRRSEALVLAMLGTALAAAGRLDEALDHASRGLALCREAGNRRAEGEILTRLGEVHAMRGDVDAAAATLDEGERGIREVGNPLDLALLLAVVAGVRVARGDVVGAERAAAEAERCPGGTERVDLVRRLDEVRARLSG